VFVTNLLVSVLKLLVMHPHHVIHHNHACHNFKIWYFYSRLFHLCMNLFHTFLVNRFILVPVGKINKSSLLIMFAIPSLSCIFWLPYGTTTFFHDPLSDAFDVPWQSLFLSMLPFAVWVANVVWLIINPVIMPSEEKWNIAVVWSSVQPKFTKYNTSEKNQSRTRASSKVAHLVIR